MTKDTKQMYRELLEIAAGDKWTRQRTQSTLGIFKSKASDKERLAMIEAIKERRPNA